MGIEPHPVKNGSPSVPMPGSNVQVLDDQVNTCKPSGTRNIVINLPLPPSCLPTLWNDNDPAEIASFFPFNTFHK